MARTEVDFTLQDRNRGKVRFRIYDRITPDDIMVHMIERELFKLVGGADPGDEVSKEFKDFVIKSATIPGR